MSWWMIAPYLEHQVEIGKITRKEADEQLKSIIEIDNRPELIISNKNSLKEKEDDMHLITGVEDGWLKVDGKVWKEYLKAKERLRI